MDVQKFIIAEIKAFIIMVVIVSVIALGLLVWFINTGGLFGRG